LIVARSVAQIVANAAGGGYMAVQGFLSLIIGFISNTLTSLFAVIDKPASNWMVLLVLFVLYAIYQKANFMRSRLTTLHEKVDDLNRRFARAEERDPAALKERLERQRRHSEKLVAETGVDLVQAQDIAKDAALAETILKFQRSMSTPPKRGG
jgi:hypothetical protein